MNPRGACTPKAFQEPRIRPLCHPSWLRQSMLPEPYGRWLRTRVRHPRYWRQSPSTGCTDEAWLPNRPLSGQELPPERLMRNNHPPVWSLSPPTPLRIVALAVESLGGRVGAPKAPQSATGERIHNQSRPVVAPASPALMPLGGGVGEPGRPGCGAGEPGPTGRGAGEPGPTGRGAGEAQPAQLSSATAGTGRAEVAAQAADPIVGRQPGVARRSPPPLPVVPARRVRTEELYRRQRGVQIP